MIHGEENRVETRLGNRGGAANRGGAVTTAIGILAHLGVRTTGARQRQINVFFF